MSGFEIAGAVLGAIPLLIEGLKVVSTIVCERTDFIVQGVTNAGSIKMGSRRPLT